MMGPAAGLGGIGDILGLIGGLNQQGQYNQTVQGISGNLNQILGTEGSDAGKLLASYMGTTLPGLQQMVQTLSPEQQQAFGNAMQSFGQVGNVAGQFLQPGSTPSMGKMGQVAQQLQNWKGLGPRELGALQSQAGNAALSAANTMKQQMGGVANPGLVMQQMANQAGQTGQNAAVQLGSLAEQQQLGAREAAGGIYGQMTGDQIQKLQDAMSGYQAQGAGYGDLSSQALSGIMNSLNQQGQAGQMGQGMLGSVGNAYGSLFSQLSQSPEATANPWASFFQNIAGMVPTSWGGGGNTMPQGGYSFGNTLGF